MKTADRIVIASKRNSSNVRVYIPEKCYIGGNLYVQPYRFIRVAVTADKINVFRGDIATFRVSTTCDIITVTEPFTMSLLDGYFAVAIGKVTAKPESRSQEIRFENITEEMVKKKNLTRYNTMKTQSPGQWQKHIYLIGDAETTQVES
jgi:hypothetical protein